MRTINVKASRPERIWHVLGTSGGQSGGSAVGQGEQGKPERVSEGPAMGNFVVCGGECGCYFFQSINANTVDFSGKLHNPINMLKRSFWLSCGEWRGSRWSQGDQTQPEQGSARLYLGLTQGW